MPGTTEITRRWSGYICPDCRFVFRVPKDHDGRGLVCPSCRRLLKLPVPGEELPPLVIPQAEPAEPLIQSAQSVSSLPQREVRRRRRRHSKTKESDAPDWEQGQGRRSASSEKILMGAMIGGAALLVAVALFVFLRSKRVEHPPAAILPKPPVDTPAIARPVSDETPDVGAFLREAEPLARSFLQARTVAELLAVVRHPTITGPRIQERHPDGQIKPPGIESFAEGGAVVLNQSTAVVKVRTATFEEREVSFYRSAEGWKIDWESWVGWSDMPWDEFKDRQPKTPTRFRVRLKPIIYYNFGFSDDQKWRSYLVESPDGNHRLFAYVERGSRVDNKINLADSPGGGDYVLDLRFPADAAGGNQVLIEERVADGWVEPDPADSP